MVTAQQCFEKYGPASNSNRNMVIWMVPLELREGKIPAKIYCNRDMIVPLTQAFVNLIERRYISELKTWDGCFNIRAMRGSGVIMSLHSWAIAVDVNAAENPFKKTPKLSAGFVECFTDAGFDWGGYWHKPDGMHFQLAKI